MADAVAEMVGKVWKIEVAMGQKVEADDIVVILESMKMEIPVMAPEGGTVKEIKCAVGQTVQEGDVLVVIG